MEGPPLHSTVPIPGGGPSLRLKRMPVAYLRILALLESADSVTKASYFPWLHFHTHTHTQHTRTHAISKHSLRWSIQENNPV